MNIEFVEDTHTYLVDGIITPSVTQIITKIMPDMYKGVPQVALKMAAGYGTKLHSLIEYWNEHHEEPDDFEKKSYEGISLRRYKEIQEEHQIETLMQEKTVAYMHEGKPLFAGTFDMMGLVDDIPSIIDIKSTQKLHNEYLTYQLTAYRIAFEQMGLGSIVDGYCLWLPKRQRGSLVKFGFLDNDRLLKEIIDVTEHHSEG